MASYVDRQYAFKMENVAIESSLTYEARSVVKNIKPTNTINAYLPTRFSLFVLLQ